MSWVATPTSLPDPPLNDAGFDSPETLTALTVVQLAIGDVDGDGHLDIVSGGGNLSGGTAQVFYGYGNGTFADPINYPTASDGWGVALGDVTGASQLDLVVASGDYMTNTIQLFVHDGGRTLSPQPAIPAGPGAYPAYEALADLDGDGFADLVTAQLDYGVVRFRGGPAGLGAAQPVGGSASPAGVAVADMDGDGRLDVVESSYDGVDILRGLPDGGLGTPVVAQTLPASEGLAVADFNGDGLLDVAITNGGDSTVFVAVLLNQGNLTLGSPILSPAGTFPTALAVGDFNRDGIPDLVVVSDRLDLLLGRGDGTLATEASYPPVGSPIYVADLNDDGRPDVVVGESADGIMIMLGH